MVTTVEDVESAFAGSAAAARTRPVLGAFALEIDVGRERAHDLAVRLPATETGSMVNSECGVSVRKGSWRATQEGETSDRLLPRTHYFPPMTGKETGETEETGARGRAPSRATQMKNGRDRHTLTTSRRTLVRDGSIHCMMRDQTIF